MLKDIYCVVLADTLTLICGFLQRFTVVLLSD